jgi:small-conductance mechanosensitive channel
VAVTIGYDTPWRQVKAMLLLAATRTPHLRAQPAPAVALTALEDFYVRYVLLVCPARPAEWVTTRDALLANILDVFNEHGVQIMSPNYEADPETAKVVPVEQWFARPAFRGGEAPPPHVDGTAV